MRTPLFAIFLLISAWSLQASAATLITGFGSSELNPIVVGSDLTGAWVGQGTESSLSFTINATNISNGGANGIIVQFGLDSDTPVNIAGNTSQLTLTGTLIGTVPETNEFAITLYDSNFQALTYDFNWSSFVGGATVTASVSALNPSFNGTVSNWELGLFGSGGDSPSNVDFTFTSLQAGTVAVPEPSTEALLALGLLFAGVVVVRRQKALAAA